MRVFGDLVGIVVSTVYSGHMGDRLLRAGQHIVVVLAYINYYPRRGLVNARNYGLDSEYEAADAFMVLAFRCAALKEVSGLVRIAPEFQEAGC